jgi:hypothetical protein
LSERSWPRSDRLATAGELADPNGKINNWPVVKDGTLKDGDIIARSLPPGSGATGHTGIVVFENGHPMTVSASSRTGTVVHNEWGFNGYHNQIDPGFIGPPQPPFADMNMTIRRCSCP